ncbi:MAG TPA: TonB-dependent receptor [Acidobacteriota bacterium]
MKGSSLFRSLIAAGFCFVFSSFLLNAQSGRGAITGIVKDPQNAIAPGVDVTATNKASGVESKTLTTDAGVYRIPYVEPGSYKITASLPGFKTAVHDNVDVGVAQVVTVDFTLEVGEVSEQITVSAKTPLLEADTPEIGTAASEKEVHTWPILVGDGTRQLQSFIFRAMPGTEGGEFAGSINGGQSYSHEILIDGISIGRYDLNGGSNNEFTPTMDAVSEFKLQTGALSAQYGNTQTALTNFGMKSGSNTFHGSVFWFHRDNSLNANSWSNNRIGLPRPPFKDNNAGGTVGGPIIKDRTHFFFSYEAERFSDQRTSGFENLPVAPFKQGDFSLLLDRNFTKDARSGTVVGKDALGRDIVFGQIYDPATTRQLADGTWIRDPFLGNIVPQGRFSQVTRNILKHDVPNPFLFLFQQNHPKVNTCCPILNIDNVSLKIDHVLASNHKLSSSFVQNNRIRLRYGGGGTPQIAGVKLPGPFMAGDKTQNTPGHIFRLSEDWTLSTGKLNHFAFGFNRFRNANVSNSFLDGRNWAEELGLRNVGGSTFPQIRFSGSNPTLSANYPRFGHQGTGDAPNGSTVMEDDFTWIRGNHSFRIGGERRWYYLNSRSSPTPGLYTFHNENTGLPGSFSTQTGFAYASFLLGVTQAAGVGVQLVNPGFRSQTTAFYFQDDWKFSSNLTLNFGLRWDIPEPFTEAANRLTSLNPKKPNPGADNFPGALEMLGSCSGCTNKSSFSDTYWRQFGPRVGFAWSNGARNFVVRGGYGINYSPPIMDGFNFPYTAGFNGSNPVIARSGRFREDPSYLWDNPYRAFTQVLPNSDPAQRNGDGIGYYLPDTNRWPYVQNWNLGVQLEAPWDTKLEINYVGNKGTRLNEPQYLFSLNQVDPKWLSLGDALIEPISQHPEIKKPYPSFNGTVARALRPFPQFEGINTHRLNSGWSKYNSLQVTGTKRSTHGLSFLAAYTFSKSLATGDTAGPGNYYDYGQNFYNRRADYSVTQFHIPHDLKLTWIYDLPWGPDRRWLREGWGGRILGGWTLSSIQRYRSGTPISIGVSGLEFDALFNGGFRADVLLPRDKQILGDKPQNIDPINGSAYLNPAAFGTPPKTARNVPLRLGNAPRWLPNLRGFALYTEDLSLIKKTYLGFREGSNLEIRFDAVNIFNRTIIGGPNTDVTSPRFGKIFGKGNAGGPRNIQLGLRFTF